MEKRKLLSIVVPTKDRYKYLKYLINLVAGLKSDEVELVIQDNSDDNTEFIRYLNELKYDFIRYDHTSGQIPMAINSDKAILNSSGDYVCFLGDDDGFTKYLLDCVKWMEKNGMEAVKSAHVLYYWPDVSQGSEKAAPSATILCKRFTGNVSFPNPVEELKKVLKKGITDRGNMPLVYHSIVSRKALDKVYEMTGTFFPGNSPDISNAVALSLTIKKFAIIDLPLAFSGCSVYHSGGVYATGKKGQPEISEIPWFRPDAEMKWDKKVPRVASNTLIWADSAINALKSMGREDLYDMVNFNKMYSYFVMRNPDLISKVFDVCTNKLAFCFVYTTEIIKKYLMSLYRRIGWVTGMVEKLNNKKNVDNIMEATAVLEAMASNVANFNTFK